VRVVNQLLPLVVIPYLARVLGPTGWGLVAFAQAFAVYGIVTVEYGFEFAGTRAVAQGREQAGRLNELVAGVLGKQLLLAAAASLVAVVIQLLVPAFRDQPLLLWAGLAFAILQGMAPIWYFTGQERIALIAGIDTAAKVLGTALVFWLVRAPFDGWLVLAASAGGLAGLDRRRLHAGPAPDPAGQAEPRPGRAHAQARREDVPDADRGHDEHRGQCLSARRAGGAAAGRVLRRRRKVLPAGRLAAAAGQRRPAAAPVAPDRPQSRPGEGAGRPHDPADGRGRARLRAGDRHRRPWLVDLFYGPQHGAAVAVMRVMALIVPLIVLNAAWSASGWLPRASTGR
jgi:hypothetical protein